MTRPHAPSAMHRSARRCIRALLAAWLSASGAAAFAVGDFGPETCVEGFVWREACGPNDHVCVVPQRRSEAAADNAQWAARRAPGGGPFGPDTCKPGFVWREACGPQDHVCVTGATRGQAKDDNAHAHERFKAHQPLWDVLTQHNDNGRSGTQPHETGLTPANVRPATFGELYQRNVDGQVIAQPLYVSNQWIPGHGLKNVVYVATRRNWIYAFDADDTDPNPNHGLIWSSPVHVAADGPVPGMCAETVGSVGITATPVIDRASDTMYVVARHQDGTIWIHAIDIATGLAKARTPGAVRLTATHPDGHGGTLVFNQALELSRAALTMADGVIHMAFSALNCDNQGWRGWVLSYRAPDLVQVGAHVTLSDPAAEGGGIWQSGNGLLEDGGHVYYLTGNGRGGTADGEAFEKLTVGPPPGYGLTPAGRYTVSNAPALNNGDTDLASGSVILLPHDRLLGGGKQGKLYVLDRATMTPTQNPPAGGPTPGGSDGFQAFVNSWHDDASLPECPIGQILDNRCYVPRHRYEDSELFGPNIHSGLIYWQGPDHAHGFVYGMPEKDHLRLFHVDHASGAVATTAARVGTVRSPDGMPGSALSLSANGDHDGVLWASIPSFDGQWHNVPGEFAAFDAVTLQEVWRDDRRFGFPKFVSPTVAGGKVFRPTFANRLIVYGLRSGGTPGYCPDVGTKYADHGAEESYLGAPQGPETALPDHVGRMRRYQYHHPIENRQVDTSIYWTPATCAHVVRDHIDDKWQATGAEHGPLGYPTTDEHVTPDGIGRYNHFQNGSVYWTAFTGAFEVHGAIHAKWAALGWERSALGYPVSDETEEMDGSGRFNVFEHGVIHWKRASGAVAVDTDGAFFTAPRQAGVDRPGGDIDNFDLPTPDPALCQERCVGNAACRAWTYVAPNTTQGPHPRCWLKGTVPPMALNGCCTSGLRIGVPLPAGALEGSHDRLGNDFANFEPPTPDPRICRAECEANPACQAWTHLTANFPARPNGTCFLKNPAPPSTENFCCVSGPR